MSHSRSSATRILTAALAAAIGLMLAGCESAPTRPAASQPTIPLTAEQSASELLTAARQAPADEAARLFLQAAWAQFNQGEVDPANETWQLIAESLLDGSDRNRYQLLAAELALARGDAAAAEHWLAELVFTDTADPRTAARACAAAGDYLCAANKLIVSANGDPAQNNLIWRYLGLAPGFEVAVEAESRTAVQRGWWQLKQATLASTTLTERHRAVSFWQQAWPDHPASARLPDQLAASLGDSWRAQHIGVILPLSGPLALAGQAVRDGFVVAYLQHKQELADTATVTFYDSESAPLPQLYEQLLADGVDLLIGPLRKELVAALGELAPEIPVLALNYLDDGVANTSHMLQLGLAIEDEAATIARELEGREIESVLLFHNYDDWSMRARKALVEDWQGRITVQSFTDLRTITESVGAAMDVGGSLERRDELAAALGEELEFLPRARQDMDVVVALVNNVEANALVPALQFHFADDLPVYASSQVVRGARRSQLKELNGFQVCELPFYITSDHLYQSMREPFALDGNRFSSLNALGIDAFRVSAMIGTLDGDNTTVMIGSTGVLSLAADGRFHRDLAWGAISNGTVVSRKVEPTRTSAGD